jgi:hypothetical protein
MFNISATISTLRTEEEMTERFEAIEEALKEYTKKIQVSSSIFFIN